MTKLDAKALEAAEAEFSECCSMPMQLALKRTITAYLSALPPAKRYWAWEIEPSCLPVLFHTEVKAKQYTCPTERVIEVEIREVRES